MFTKKSIIRMFSVLLVVLLVSGTASARPLEAALGTGFTYQGKLTDGGAPANGTYDFEFKLYDAVNGGNPVGGTVTLGDVSVTNGLFTVQLDFGNVFDGTALYLEIGVRPGGSGGAYTMLTPRQPLSPTPYALYTTQADNADRLDTYHASNTAGNIPINNSTLNTTLNSDLLDGQHGTYYQNVSNINSGALGDNYFSAYADLVAEGYLGNVENDLALNNGTLQATLNADLLDGLNAINFALTGHNHWGETWSGSGTGLTLSGGSTGLSSSGSNYGVYGEGSIGVRGSGTSGGVYGQVDSTPGTGVHGYASAASGTTYGIYGRSNSPAGFGVFGFAAAVSGWANGVFGQSASNDGNGVYGYATAASGLANGVVGKSESTSGTGVYGDATATSGTTYGVNGTASSTNGTGVMGLASATSGTTYGVYGRSDSTSTGVGVYGTGRTGVSGTGINYGQSSGTGVSGYGTFGVRGTGVYGVWGVATLSSGYGIFGSAYDGTGDYAGYFQGNVRIVGNSTITGTKSAVVDTKDYSTRALYSVESPEVWFEDFGTAQLVEGAVTVTFEPIFAQTVALTDTYHVLVTPLCDSPVLLFVTQKSPTGFTVRGVTIDNQPSQCTFDYRIAAKRLGYENVRLAEVADTQPLLPPEGGAK